MHREEMRIGGWWLLVLLIGSACGVGVPGTPAFADACPLGGEHTYDVVITVYPTDDEDGIRNYTCTKCGSSIDKIIPAVGHAWSEWVVDLMPTCTSEGHEYRECAKQGDVVHREEQIIAMLSPTGDHGYELTGEKKSTCTEEGQLTYTCSYCGEVQTESVAILGHEWKEWEIVVEPKPASPGEKRRVCVHDETHVEVEAIPAIDKETSKKTGSFKKEETPKSSHEDDTQVPALYLQFTSFDAAFVFLDAILAAVFFALSIPLIMQFRFNQKRRAAARMKGKQATVESERREGDWWL